MKILFLGQNPALAVRSIGEDRAFFNTRSGKILFGWLKEAKVPMEMCSFENVYPHFTASNACPKISQVDLGRLENIIKSYNSLVVLGKFAAKAVKKIDVTNVKIVHVEHPSGLNRNLNNVETHLECIKKIREAMGA